MDIRQSFVWRRSDKWRKFKKTGIGYYSFLIIVVLCLLVSVVELFINNRALVVKYESEYYFPVISGFHPGKTFGETYGYETDYRELEKKFEDAGSSNWVIMPFIPYNPYEIEIIDPEPPPHSPSLTSGHYLGTDNSGRDLLARLAYGFRTGIYFSFFLYALSTIIGVCVGCMMGYYGGRFDISMHRFVEIWSQLPSLYIIMIIASILVPGFWILLIVMVIFEWTSMTMQMRAEIYREKSRAYCEVAKAMGASDMRIISKHLLPNSVVPIVARMPFQIVGGINALTGLDYLGYGLPVPTPSWGELLKQGQESFSYAPWVLLSPFFAIFFILFLFTFFGEALREVFDPKSNTLKGA